VEVLVAVEVEPFEEGEPCRRPVRLGDRDCASLPLQPTAHGDLGLARHCARLLVLQVRQGAGDAMTGFGFRPDHMLREGYRCCKSCERVMPTVLGFEEYGSGYRRVCRDCRALAKTMRTWSGEATR
jgi:hypothetical protein